MYLKYINILLTHTPPVRYDRNYNIHDYPYRSDKDFVT